MDPFQLTPRQLLILLFTACRDAGYDQVPRQLVNETLYELRFTECDPVPTFAFMLSAMKRFSLDLDRAYGELQKDGSIVIDADGRISIPEHLSCAEVYKPLGYEERRIKLAEQINPYVSEFMRHVIPSLACIPERPEPRDPRSA
ncbi:MAG TPA: hypothetical protein VMU11_03375 [Verrucomicrobiae bacterium]|nr:hypothetical protein [Verrucomicrobiae bacterium]